jgi:hypothetical protein
VPNVGPQQFVGYLNLKKFLKRIVPTFRDATDVLLTGISAGGYGAANTSFLVQRAFPSVKVKTIIDSGPMLPTSVYAECWQERHRTMWKLEDSYLGDCGSACPNKNDHSLDYGVFLARAFADRPSGLISTTADSVERSFLGIGNDHCTGKVDLLFSAPGISAAKYREGVLAYREKVRPFANFGTFLMDSDEHTFIATDNFYTASSGGIRLRDWFAKILTGEAPGHVGP